VPLATLKKVAEYARKGGIVIATGRVPSLAPGFLEAKADTPQIRDLARALFEVAGAPGHLVKDDAKLGETLHGLLKPDVTAPPEIGFVHRKLPSRDNLYFLVNTSNHRVRGTLGFRDGWTAERCRSKKRVLPSLMDLRSVGSDWYGVRHYVAQQETLHLYGSVAGKLPEWFTERFPAEYHRKRIFSEPPEKPLHVTPLEGRDSGPQVSSPERAMLELLSEIGVRQPLQEARELMESAYNLRADVLRELLKRCTSVKTVRLCLQLGRESSLPWAQKLNPAELPTGSARPWVARSSGGLLVLKPAVRQKRTGVRTQRCHAF